MPQKKVSKKKKSAKRTSRKAVKKTSKVVKKKAKAPKKKAVSTKEPVKKEIPLKKLPVWPIVIMFGLFVALYIYDYTLHSQPDEITFVWPLVDHNLQDSYWLSQALLSDDPVYSTNILKMMACEDYILPHVLEHSDPVEAIAATHEILKMQVPSSAIQRRGFNPGVVNKFRNCPIKSHVVLSELNIEKIVRASWNHYRVDSIAETVAALGPQEAVKFIMRQYGVDKQEAQETYQNNFVNKPDTKEIQCGIDYSQHDIICKQIGIYSTSNLARLIFHGYMLT